MQSDQNPAPSLRVRRHHVGKIEKIDLRAVVRFTLEPADVRRLAELFQDAVTYGTDVHAEMTFTGGPAVLLTVSYQQRPDAVQWMEAGKLAAELGISSARLRALCRELGGDLQRGKGKELVISHELAETVRGEAGKKRQARKKDGQDSSA